MAANVTLVGIITLLGALFWVILVILIELELVGNSFCRCLLWDVEFIGELNLGIYELEFFPLIAWQGLLVGVLIFNICHLHRSKIFSTYMWLEFVFCELILICFYFILANSKMILFSWISPNMFVTDSFEFAIGLFFARLNNKVIFNTHLDIYIYVPPILSAPIMWWNHKALI